MSRRGVRPGVAGLDKILEVLFLMCSFTVLLSAATDDPRKFAPPDQIGLMRHNASGHESFISLTTSRKSGHAPRAD